MAVETKTESRWPRWWAPSSAPEEYHHCHHRPQPPWPWAPVWLVRKPPPQPPPRPDSSDSSPSAHLALHGTTSKPPHDHLFSLATTVMPLQPNLAMLLTLGGSSLHHADERGYVREGVLIQPGAMCLLVQRSLPSAASETPTGTSSRGGSHLPASAMSTKDSNLPASVSSCVLIASTEHAAHTTACAPPLVHHGQPHHVTH